MDVEIRLLGPVGIWDGARHLGPSAAQQRTVLAALALDRGHVVPMERLVTALWGTAPPATARNVVQVCVSRLRTTLGSAGAVRGTAQGYSLDTGRQAIDLYRFRDLVRRAGQCEPAQARDLVEAALRLWRGPALADVAGPWLGEVVAPRLAEERFAALELRAGLDLAMGRHGTVIDDLTEVVAEAPTREGLVLALLTALHRDGRRPAALALFRRVRRQYIDELGIEPGAELQRAHRAILDGAPPEPAGPVPRQLPAATALFVGREAELRQLDALLTRGATVAVVSGPAGAGKSTLVLRWAHAAARHFPDGQLFLDMRGFDRAEGMTPREAMPLLLQGLGCRPREIPPTLDGQVALYRTMVADRRVLLVLDDVAHRDQIRDLLPGGEGSLALITSRDRMAGLAATTGARRIACGVLDPGASVALLGRALGVGRVSAEPAAAARLAELCDHLPLALCVAASQVGEDAGGIGRFVARLAGRDRLGQLRIVGEEHAAVRAALDASYQMLPASARAVVRSLGLLPGTGRSAAAVAAALKGAGNDDDSSSGVDGGVEEALGAAVRLHLLRWAGPGEVAWHDLVHEFATERLHAEETAREREAATARLLEHYLRTAVEAARACGFAVPRPPLGAAGRGVPFAGAAEAHAWFDATWAEMAVTVTHVAAHGPRRYAWLLVDALRDLLQHRRPLSDLVRMTEIGLRAGEEEGDPVGRAAMHLLAGRARWRAGDLPSALAEFGTGGRLARETAWLSGEASAEQGTGIVLKQLGEPEQALGHYRRAAALNREVGDEAGEAGALSNLGSAHLLLGHLRQAEEALNAALPLATRTDQHLRALVLVNLGEVRQGQGRLDGSLAVLHEALGAADTAGSPYARATALENIGLVRVEAGEYEAAKAAFAEALELARRVENRTGEASVLIGLADLATAEGRFEDAAAHLATAGRLADRVGVTAARSAVLRGEAALRLARGCPAEALPLLEQAGSLAAAGSPLLLPAVRLLEARALAALGDADGAARAAKEACRLAEESGQERVRSRAAQLF
jgi:DNA-binding SARP family transcriptional activator/tetratricopeptide (TPR) repeat protein